MKNLGYGDGYRYAHDEEGGFAAGEAYFPDDMPAQQFYAPVDRGMEAKIRGKARRPCANAMASKQQESHVTQ